MLRFKLSHCLSWASSVRAQDLCVRAPAACRQDGKETSYLASLPSVPWREAGSRPSRALGHAGAPARGHGYPPTDPEENQPHLA